MSLLLPAATFMQLDNGIEENYSQLYHWSVAYMRHFFIFIKQ